LIDGFAEEIPLCYDDFDDVDDIHLYQIQYHEVWDISCFLIIAFFIPCIIK